MFVRAYYYFTLRSDNILWMLNNLTNRSEVEKQTRGIDRLSLAGSPDERNDDLLIIYVVIFLIQLSDKPTTWQHHHRHIHYKGKINV